MQLNKLPATEVCILIPCFNNMDGLIKSMNSINYFTNKYFVLIVDDGSSEMITVPEVTSKLTEKVNFQIVRLNKNGGIINALNIGLDYIYNNISSQYIARLDCGDICHPEKFNAQVTYLNLNPSIHLLGTWCYFKDVKTFKSYSYITPTKHKSIIRGMNFRNVFIHPTVMWRFEGLEQIKYPTKYLYAEDYGLFYNMITKVKSAILNDFLITCEINQNGISQQNRTVQLQSRLDVIDDYKTSNFYYIIGFIKLKILMLVPYKFILNIKMVLFKR